MKLRVIVYDLKAGPRAKPIVDQVLALTDGLMLAKNEHTLRVCREPGRYKVMLEWLGHCD